MDFEKVLEQLETELNECYHIRHIDVPVGSGCSVEVVPLGEGWYCYRGRTPKLKKAWVLSKTKSLVNYIWVEWLDLCKDRAREATEEFLREL